jgi:hypothetical protein
MTIIVNGSNTPTAGAVGYGDGTNLAFTSAGTTGQFLSSNGSSAPSWVGAPASAMTLISTQTANNTSQYLTWTGLTGYNSYKIILNNLTLTSAGNYFELIVGTGSTPTYLSSGYATQILSAYGSTVTGFYRNFAAAFFEIGPYNGNLVAGPFNAEITIYNINNGGYVAFTSLGICEYSSGNYETTTSAGTNLSNTSTITALRISSNSGANIVSGTASLYGISS